MKKYLDSTVVIFAFLLSFSTIVRAQNEVTVIAPGDMRAVLDHLSPAFEQNTGHKVTATIGSGLATKKRVIQGDAFDVVIVQPPLPDVISSGNVVANTQKPIATVAVGVAVRKGTTKPDISTPDAVKQMLLAAKSVTYPDPARGAAAGVTLDEMFKTLGITDQMQAKVKRVQGVGPAALVARGDAEICLTFLSEIEDPGVEIIGPLPPQIAKITELVGFVSTHAKDPATAKAFLDYISSTEVAGVYKTAKMEPSNVRAADEKYQMVENWAQLPQGMQWGVMSAVGIDPHGTIYAFKRSEPGEKAGAMTSMVIVLDPNGKFLRSWGQNTFMSAHGLRVLTDGFIWITDKTGDQVFKFSPDGDLLMTLGKKGVAGDNNSTDGTLNGPTDVVLAKNGDIFVADGESANTRVVKFSKDGKFIKYWGTKGSEPGELETPHSIAMDSKGRLYVANRGNKRIDVFDQDGKYLDQMNQFGAPAGIFITKDDILYVVAGAPENRLTVGTTDGKVLDRVEGLNGPHEMAVDSSGAVYVAEVAGQALVKFVKK